MIADDARLKPPRCKKHTGSTGRRVNGSTGQWVTFTFTILYMMPGSHHPAAKSTRRMMTPGSCHTAAKSTQRLLLARRVNFLVVYNTKKTVCMCVKPKQLKSTIVHEFVLSGNSLKHAVKQQIIKMILISDSNVGMYIYYILYIAEGIC